MHQELPHLQNHLFIARQGQFLHLTQHLALPASTGQAAQVDMPTRRHDNLRNNPSSQTPLLFADRKDAVLTLEGCVKPGVGAASSPRQRRVPSLGAGKPSSTRGLRPGGCSSSSAGSSWLPGAGGCGQEGTGDIRLGTPGFERSPSKPNPTASLT